MTAASRMPPPNLHLPPPRSSGPTVHCGRAVAVTVMVCRFWGRLYSQASLSLSHHSHHLLCVMSGPTETPRCGGTEASCRQPQSELKSGSSCVSQPFRDSRSPGQQLNYDGTGKWNYPTKLWLDSWPSQTVWNVCPLKLISLGVIWYKERRAKYWVSQKCHLVFP